MATVKDVFNQIAPSWYNFRHRSIFKRELEDLAERWGGGRLLNLGCAHGPDFLPFKRDFELYGADIATEMLRLARKYSQKFDFAVHLAATSRCTWPLPTSASCLIQTTRSTTQFRSPRITTSKVRLINWQRCRS